MKIEWRKGREKEKKLWEGEREKEREKRKIEGTDRREYSLFHFLSLILTLVAPSTSSLGIPVAKKTSRK